MNKAKAKMLIWIQYLTKNRNAELNLIVYVPNDIYLCIYTNNLFVIIILFNHIKHSMYNNYALEKYQW